MAVLILSATAMSAIGKAPGVGDLLMLCARVPSSGKGGATLSGVRSCWLRSSICGLISPNLTCSRRLDCAASKSRELSPLHGPVPVGTQLPWKGAATMPPERTVTKVVLSSVKVEKSVPRMPMAATGVLRRNLSRAFCAPTPDTDRMTPLCKVSLMSVSAGLAGS